MPVRPSLRLLNGTVMAAAVRTAAGAPTAAARAGVLAAYMAVAAHGQAAVISMAEVPLGPAAAASIVEVAPAAARVIAAADIVAAPQTQAAAVFIAVAGISEAARRRPGALAHLHLAVSAASVRRAAESGPGEGPARAALTEAGLARRQDAARLTPAISGIPSGAAALLGRARFPRHASPVITLTAGVHLAAVREISSRASSAPVPPSQGVQTFQ